MRLPCTRAGTCPHLSRLHFQAFGRTGRGCPPQSPQSHVWKGAAPAWTSTRATPNGRARVEFAGSNDSLTQNTAHDNECKATTHFDNARHATNKVSSGLLAKLASQVSDSVCSYSNLSCNMQAYLRMDMKKLIQNCQ